MVASTEAAWTPMTARSFTLARLRRHREAFLNPRLPERCLAGDGPGRLIAVEVEAQRDHDRSAAVDGAKGGGARTRLVEPHQGVARTLADVLHHAAERRDARRGGPALPRAHALQPQCRGQRFPGLRVGSCSGGHPLHHRGALAAEVREIEPQDAEEARPAGLGAFQLVVPVVRAGEEAMHHADDADASPARFDAPLVRDGRRARDPAIGLGGKHPRRIPGRHGGTGLHARAEVQRHRNGLPVELLELSRHEPGRDTRPGGDGLPDFLRRAWDLDFDLDGTASGGFFLHAHDGSLGSDFCGRGCATTTRRCARPPGADSSWYFDTSFVMASVSSWLKAARSVADRKPTSVSTARVARRLPVSFARRTRSPTSRTTRAPRAMR